MTEQETSTTGCVCIAVHIVYTEHILCWFRVVSSTIGPIILGDSSGHVRVHILDRRQPHLVGKYYVSGEASYMQFSGNYPYTVATPCDTDATFCRAVHYIFLFRHEYSC